MALPAASGFLPGIAGGTRHSIRPNHGGAEQNGNFASLLGQQSEGRVLPPSGRGKTRDVAASSEVCAGPETGYASCDSAD